MTQLSVFSVRSATPLCVAAHKAAALLEHDRFHTFWERGNESRGERLGYKKTNHGEESLPIILTTMGLSEQTAVQLVCLS